MFNQKPVIALRKEDESAFVNPRTYWALTAHIGPRPDDRCYELRVKHAYPEDEFIFVHIDMGDEMVLQTPDEFENRRETIAQNETVTCDRHLAMTEEETDAEIDRLASLRALPPNGEFAWLCDECRAASLNRADAFLADRARAMDKTEAKVLLELRRHWDAFLLLFNPAINTF
jgi:hypothetical protein